eukprot:scaffold49349_cov72-Phaeocystis_antarctica.AAC.2
MALHAVYTTHWLRGLRHVSLSLSLSVQIQVAGAFQAGPAAGSLPSHGSHSAICALNQPQPGQELFTAPAVPAPS